MFQLRQSLLLFITATIWGSGFVAQSVGMDHVTPFTYTFFRTFLGALFLLPIITILRKLKANKAAKAQVQAQVQGQAQAQSSAYSSVQDSGKQAQSARPKARRELLIGSICCGLCLLSAESFQQFGLVTTEAGKAGFITSLYVIGVPILGLFVGKKLNLGIVIGIVMSLVGLYLLCIKGSFTISHGDLLIVICAIIFSVHILTIDHFVQKCDGVALACGQFFAASFFAFILMMIFDYDVFAWENVKAAGLAILWSGIMSNGVAYTLQIVGQRGMHPTIATLILSLESVMAVLFGMLILDETMTSREAVGCFLILLAVIIAQVNLKPLFKRLFAKKAAKKAAKLANS